MKYYAFCCAFCAFRRNNELTDPNRIWGEYNVIFEQ